MEEVILRPKLDRWTAREDRLNFLADLLGRAEVVSVHGVVKVCRDPKDDRFPSLAGSAGAGHRVRSDKDLLVLDPSNGIRILTSRDYLDA